MSYPSFTVVVPVRNGEATIRACIESLVAQQYPADRFDIIVVDNGSTDGTAQIVAPYPLTVVQCDTLGPSPARNAGVWHARGEIVAFTDADCVADTGWIAALARAFSEEAIGAAGGAIEPLRHPNRNVVERFGEHLPPLQNYRSGDNEFLPFLISANAAYRRAPLLAAGGWDDAMGSAEDIELAWRFQLRTGTKLAFCSDAVIYHRHRATVRALARQYWVYGLGEVLLDSVFGTQSGYPRDRRFYRQRLPQQLAALPRYVGAAVLRAIDRLGGRGSAYDVARPCLLTLAEAANIAGKLEGLRLTRGLRDPEPLRRHLVRAIPSQHVARVTRA
jgi:glycosyltransferase involved in cell wall biosynthesis